MDAMPTEMHKDRARTWVYDVINPLEDALETELTFLERGNVTWRFHTKRLEIIRPPAEYLDREGRRNLEQLGRHDPRVRQAVDSHAEEVGRLEASAAERHRRLLAEPDFQATVDEAMRKFAESTGTEPWAAWGPEHMVAIAAERVINHVEALPPHYFDATFWPTARERIVQAAAGDDAERLKASIQACIVDARSLRDVLAQARDRLCDANDLPAGRPGVTDAP